MESNLNFKKPSFFKRLKGMLSVDFYRLFHTPMFYIFLAIAAIIPALVLSSSIMGDGTQEVQALYNNTWQIIAAEEPLYIVNSISDYANMNMVFIFGGMMISIFIGHDYKSGYVKQLFTTHSKKRDYIISKSFVGAFSMACMCITYLAGTILAGLISGMSFSVSVSSLIIAILGKMIMSFGWASLYAFINIILRRYFGISIVSSFILGTGVIIIGAAGILGNSSILNIFLYGSSVFACLSSGILTLAVCAVTSIVWAIIYNILGSIILSRSDVY